MRVAIIGAGYWGQKHIRVFHGLPLAQVAIVCDRDPARLEMVKRLYPWVYTTTAYVEVLASDVEAVVIATPVTTHYSLAKQALSAGKHVLVEKPMTDRYAEAWDLVQMAEQRRQVLMVGYTYLYHPAVKFLRDFLAEGELGDLYYVDSARLSLGLFRPDVDVIWDLASHDISILSFLLGSDPLWISAQASARVNPATIEVSYLGLGFPKDVLAHAHVSWLDPWKVRRLTLVGSKRMAVFDDMDPQDRVHIYDKGASLFHGGNGNGAPSVQYRYGEGRIPHLADTEPLEEECRHFLECIASGERPLSDGYMGLKTVSILEAAHRSVLGGGQPVVLEALEPPAVAPRLNGVSVGV